MGNKRYKAIRIRIELWKQMRQEGLDQEMSLLDLADKMWEAYKKLKKEK